MANQDTFLQMVGISKSYPGVQALKGVNFSINSGEIHALVGENGAGKSTLMKILTGSQLPDTGDILLRNHAVNIKTPAAAQAYGISMIHQELSLIPDLTVGQNIFLGREPQGRLPGFIDWSSLYQQAQQLLNQLDVPVNARDEVNSLSIAQQQMVEVAKALSLKADLIAMDEPTSALTDRETETLFSLMRSLKAQGVALIFISHRLEEVFEISDQVTILRDGQLIDTVPLAGLTEADVIRMMVGRQMTDLYPARAITPEGVSVVLQATNLSDGRELHGVDLTLHRGEILGIAGLVGAGRTALAEILFGIRPMITGKLTIDGEVVDHNSPDNAIQMGLGFVPEDRKLQGLFMNMAVRENIMFGAMDQVSDWGFVNFGRANHLADRFVSKLGIRTPSVQQRVRNLSGGNQQKVVIARWLTRQPKVLILDEPTRGIDVGAKAEIHALMNELAQAGVGVLMISSELPEILGISDRILVMHEGRITAEFPGKQATQDKIMVAATGGRQDYVQ